jgi:hypothetical protein
MLESSILKGDDNFGNLGADGKIDRHEIAANDVYWINVIHNRVS